VLRLENLSGDPSQEYFADGITDALITQLAKLHGLRVISRTSIMQYKSLRKPLPDIARDLNVDAVVEGSVSRSGNRVRVTAQLVDAHADRHLWAEEYDRDLREILSLQANLRATSPKRFAPTFHRRSSCSWPAPERLNRQPMKAISVAAPSGTNARLPA
jgi:TolB-like protein